MCREPVRDRSHRMFADAKMQVAPRITPTAALRTLGIFTPLESAG